MQTKVYVDVLILLNYIINLLLIQCVAKLTGRRLKRRRLVLAAFFGAASAMSIFLPFFGFFISLLSKLLISSGIVLIAFHYIGLKVYLKQLFAFFAVSFFFAGVMLAIWMVVAPKGMLYYNGVVYFDISSLTLIITTAAAYLVLTLAHRFTREGRLKTEIYRLEIFLGKKSVVLHGLVDTGNSLYEPFSDTPVMVCNVVDLLPILPLPLMEELMRGTSELPDSKKYGLVFRLVPYSHIKGAGMIPAFQPDRILLDGPAGQLIAENVFIAVTNEKIGKDGYSAILNPDIIGVANTPAAPAII